MPIAIAAVRGRTPHRSARGAMTVCATQTERRLRARDSGPSVPFYRSADEARCAQRTEYLYDIATLQERALVPPTERSLQRNLRSGCLRLKESVPSLRLSLMKCTAAPVETRVHGSAGRAASSRMASVRVTSACSGVPPGQKMTFRR